MGFNAVLFDLDGTLLDTLADIAHAVNTALAGLGYAQHPVSAYKYFVGEGIDVLAHRVLPDDKKTPENAAACLNAINREYGKGLLVKTRPFSGVVELLQTLAAKKVKTGVITNKPQYLTDRSIAEFFPHIPFAVVLGEQKDRPTKPDPFIAHMALKTIGVAPAQCLYVGDSGIDMQTAVNSGMFGVGVLWGFRPKEELLATGAKKIIAKPDEILEFF